MIERAAKGRSGFRRMPDKKGGRMAIEILVEEQECPFCHFAKLKKDGNQIVCPICGYGHKVCT